MVRIQQKKERERKIPQANQDDMDWPQAYLHRVCKLHYERKKSNKYKKNIPLHPYIKISQQKISKLLQKLFGISLEASLYYQDVTSYPI